MKKIFYASFIAVLTGVVLLGVNAAFGANTPSVAPENADLVSPVFGGADIRGPIQNTSADNNGSVIVTDDFAVEKDLSSNNLFVGKNAQIGEILSAADVIISKNATGDIISSDPADPILFGSKVVVDGSLTANKSFFAEGKSLFSDDVTMDKDLDVWGQIINSGLQWVEVGSNLRATGDTEINGDLTIGYENPEIARQVQINGNTSMKGKLDVGGAIDAKSLIKNSTVDQSVVPVPLPVVIDDDLQVNKILKVFETTFLIKDVQASAKLNVIGKTNTAGGLLVNNGLTVSGNAAFADNVEVTGSISNPNFLPLDIQSDVDINGSMSTTGNLYVNGTISAEQFGSYTRRMGDWFNVLVNATGTNTKACIAGEIVISCGADVWDNFKDVELNEIDFDNIANSCTVTATNKSAANSRWFRSTALCFNPGL